MLFGLIGGEKPSFKRLQQEGTEFIIPKHPELQGVRFKVLGVTQPEGFFGRKGSATVAAVSGQELPVPNPEAPGKGILGFFRQLLSVSTVFLKKAFFGGLKIVDPLNPESGKQYKIQLVG